MQEYTVRVYIDCTKWFQNDQLHREDGPAIERSNGDKTWYQNGKLHRVDGPAIVYENTALWYIDGVMIPSSTIAAAQAIACINHYSGVWDDYKCDLDKNKVKTYIDMADAAIKAYKNAIE